MTHQWRALERRGGRRKKTSAQYRGGFAASARCCARCRLPATPCAQRCCRAALGVPPRATAKLRPIGRATAQVGIRHVHPPERADPQREILQDTSGRAQLHSQGVRVHPHSL
eukprot:scaffold18426_cov101-Isochrysis_galbana.AAC.4